MRQARTFLMVILAVTSVLVAIGADTPKAAADSCSDCGESDTDLLFIYNNSNVTSAPYGQPVILDAIVSDVSGSCDIGDCNTPSGKVYFFDNGDTGYFALAPADPDDYTPDDSTDTNAGFEATVANLAVGTHSIRALYQSPIESLENPHHFDNSEDTKSLEITQASSSISGSVSASSSAYGSGLLFGAHVAPNPAVDPSASLPTGNVELVDVTGGGNTTLQTKAINASGDVSFTESSLSVGVHKIVMVYDGDTNYNAHSTDQFTQTVTQANTTTGVAVTPNPSTYNTSVTMTATVSPTNATGSVTFTVDGASTFTATVSGGTATAMHAGFGAGPHSISAAYSGDTNYVGSTGTSSFTVDKAGTMTGLSSSPNPSVFGQPVTITGTVSPSTAPGSVLFSDGASSLGSGTLSSGTASVTTSALSVGSHTLNGHYAGDDNYESSDASPITQVVNKADTTTVLTGPAHAVDFGGNAKLTVAVGAVAPGAGTPSGTVTLREGPAVLGTSSLHSGAGAFTVANLLPGSHSMIATYSGDGNFNGSTSSPVVVSVTCKTNKTSPSGSFTAGSGSTCVTGDVNGSINLSSGARLFISHATVTGDIVGSSASQLALCGVTMRGNLNLANTKGPIVIGDAVNNRCAGNTISGIVSIMSTAKGLIVGDNTLAKDLNLNSNHKGTAVENNLITGQLSCSSNQPKPTNNGRPNHAGARYGQCVTL
ncbi:MAG TPA: Ig-like domain-containing protein [Acidimicrobiales bacterium]|nr:Ig-like domain-containing protein [Acidimicrobiales bacterium]